MSVDLNLCVPSVTPLTTSTAHNVAADHPGKQGKAPPEPAIIQMQYNDLVKRRTKSEAEKGGAP